MESTLHDRIITTVWKQWYGDHNNGIKPIWEYWKAVHHVTHQGEWATNSLLNMLFEEMRMYPEQQHFELATGGLLLIVEYNGEAYVTLAVTCHMIGDTRHAYDY